ncbi:MAG: monovalent cation/H(+) antiporter subunit G [bacterium]|nr:monovalent cation/H(+) antiporter subunit G [bacterium]
MISYLGAGITVLGGCALFLAALGVWALPDALSRQHAATKAGTLALALICLGSACLMQQWAWSGRVIVITCFVMASLPASSQMLARAAVVEQDGELVVPEQLPTF